MRMPEFFFRRFQLCVKNKRSHRPVRTCGSFGKNNPPIFVDGTPASAEAPAVVGLPPPDRPVLSGS
jgi:hypothetical protein